LAPVTIPAPIWSFQGVPACPPLRWAGATPARRLISPDWTDWDSLDVVNFERDDSVTVPFVFNYQSSFMYEFGVTRQLGQGWFASLGYIYSENSSPDTHFNPIVPDDDLHLGSIGFGRRGQRWDWAIGYHFAYGDREVSDAIIPLF
jgi:long-subunit fatty acid transport protein